MADMILSLASCCCRHLRARCLRISAVLQRRSHMAEKRVMPRRRAGRPPAGARAGEKVKDYPQLSIRVPVEMKARLNALSAVTGLAQWRLIVEAIDCFLRGPARQRSRAGGRPQPTSHEGRVVATCPTRRGTTDAAPPRPPQRCQQLSGAWSVTESVTNRADGLDR